MKTKSKLISIALLLVLAVSIFSPLKAQAAEKIKLNKAKVVLEVDAKITLKLGDIKGTDVKWSSSAKKVATVSKSGVVTAKSEGTATITATYKSKKYTCQIISVDSNKGENNEKKSETAKIVKEYYDGDYYFVIVKNDTSNTAKITANVTVRDSNGEMIGYKDRSEGAVPSGGEICLVFGIYDKNAESFETVVKSEKDKYNTPVTQNMIIEGKELDDKILLSVTNKGDIDAGILDAYILFFKKGKLVDWTIEFICNSDYMIKPGEKCIEEIDVYKSYDEYKVYLLGSEY